MNFHVVINEKLNQIKTDKFDFDMSNEFDCDISNKFVLSIVNRFQSGKWHFKSFENFIWDNIKETALSASERNLLVGKESSIINLAAQNLRLTDKEIESTKGSELAEIVLYGVMKEFYGALPVVPKIFHKQNSQDNAKGADSVHIVVKDKDYTLWFGEAKFYNSIEDARLDRVVASVQESLTDSKINKENSIITSLNDLDNLGIDAGLVNTIKSALARGKTLDDIKGKINIPILLLHECEITKNSTELSDSYKDEIAKYHLSRAISYYKKQVKKMASIHKYFDIKFHLILLPVPSKKNVVDVFYKSANFHRGV